MFRERKSEIRRRRECRRRTNTIPIKSVGNVCWNKFFGFHANLMKFENWQKFISIYFVVILFYYYHHYYYFYIQIVLRRKKIYPSIWNTENDCGCLKYGFIIHNAETKKMRQNGKLTITKTFTIISAIPINFLFHANVKEGSKKTNNLQY